PGSAGNQGPQGATGPQGVTGPPGPLEPAASDVKDQAVTVAGGDSATINSVALPAGHNWVLIENANVYNNDTAHVTRAECTMADGSSNTLDFFKERLNDTGDSTTSGAQTQFEQISMVGQASGGQTVTV